MFAWLGACGGQTDLDPAEAFHADAAGGTRGTGAVGAGGTGGKAGTGAVGAGGQFGTGGAADAGNDVPPIESSQTRPFGMLRTTTPALRSTRTSRAAVRWAIGSWRYACLRLRPG